MNIKQTEQQIDKYQSLMNNCKDDENEAFECLKSIRDKLVIELGAKMKYVNAWNNHINEITSISWNLDQKDFDKLKDLQLKIKTLVLKGADKVTH